MKQDQQVGAASRTQPVGPGANRITSELAPVADLRVGRIAQNMKTIALLCLSDAEHGGRLR